MMMMLFQVLMMIMVVMTMVMTMVTMMVAELFPRVRGEGADGYPGQVLLQRQAHLSICGTLNYFSIFLFAVSFFLIIMTKLVVVPWT